MMTLSVVDTIMVGHHSETALAAGVPGFFGFIVLRQCLQATHVVRPIVIAVVVGNAVNALGNLYFIFYLGLGAAGSGISTSIARWLMLLTLAVAGAPSLRDV